MQGSLVVGHLVIPLQPSPLQVKVLTGFLGKETGLTILATLTNRKHLPREILPYPQT